VAKRGKQAELKTYHAVVHVTRIEEWIVDATSSKEAESLLLQGRGHQLGSGECVDVRLERMGEN
jgi:hypothetical protein